MSVYIYIYRCTVKSKSRVVRMYIDFCPCLLSVESTKEKGIREMNRKGEKGERMRIEHCGVAKEVI